MPAPPSYKLACLSESIFCHSFIFQKYKPHSNGAANQKWHYVANTRTFIAFHSTALDRKITAANSSGLCTSSVTKENIDQPVSSSLFPKMEEK